MVYGCAPDFLVGVVRWRTGLVGGGGKGAGMARERGTQTAARRGEARQGALQQGFQEVFLGLRAWRERHPQANFAAIEGELDAQRSQLRAQRDREVVVC